MKSAQDPRHLKRRKIIQDLFAWSFQKKQSKSLKPILDELSKIDEIITQAAPQFPVEKIAKVDLAILRLAVFELRQKKEPVKVIIDEAVELTKEFGGETNPAFINGVLGKVLKI